MPKQIYEVRYEGVYLGGAAIVLADSETEAIGLVATHANTQSFFNPTTKLVTADFDNAAVLYNDNGDY